MNTHEFINYSLKCGGGDLTSEEIVKVDYLYEKTKRKSAFMGDEGQKIKVTVGSAKRYVVERMGEVEEVEARNVFFLKKKVLEGRKRGQTWSAQTFVNDGCFKYDFHAPALDGKAEYVLKLSMFINQKGELVMVSVVQQEGFVWTSKTIAQRD